MEAARLSDDDARSALASLPRRGIRFKKGEIEELIAEFRRTRDGHRGRYAAPIEELPGGAERIATAIVRASQKTSDADELKHLAEDLVDLQGFVDLEGASAPLPPAAGRPASPVLEFVRWRQAAAIHFLTEDASVVGDKVAQQGKWTPIGDARAAIGRVRDYRDTQAGGILGMLSWVFAAPAGAILGEVAGLGHVTLAVWIVLGVAWFASPVIGAVVTEPYGRLMDGAQKRTGLDDLPDIVMLPLLLGPLVLIFAAIGVLIVAVQGRVGV